VLGEELEALAPEGHPNHRLVAVAVALVVMIVPRRVRLGVIVALIVLVTAGEDRE